MSAIAVRMTTLAARWLHKYASTSNGRDRGCGPRQLHLPTLSDPTSSHPVGPTSRSSAHQAAEGERSAVRGYGWQYDWIGERVLDALLADDLLKVQLVNPEVGRVDDLVLFRIGRIDGYQFKTSEDGGYITFRDLTGPQRLPGDLPTPPR